MTTTKQSGPGFRLSVAVIVIGIAVGIPSAVKVVSPFVGAFSSPALSTPGRTSLHLRAGEYKVFELTGNSSGGGGFNFGRNNGVTLGSEGVRVTGDEGPVPTHSVEPFETLTRGSRVFTSAVAFSVLRSGQYEIDVASVPGGQVLISRSLGQTFRQAAPWLGTGALAVLILAIGFTMLIVGSVRRGRVSSAPPAHPAHPATPAAAPPNWYPDPEGRGGLRYWDGAHWTDHRA